MYAMFLVSLRKSHTILGHFEVEIAENYGHGIG